MPLSTTETLHRTGDIICSVDGDNVIPILDVSSVPTKYIQLFEASMLLYRFVNDIREPLHSILNYLETQNVDATTPAIVSLITGSDLMIETVDRGVFAVASKFLDK